MKYLKYYEKNIKKSKNKYNLCKTGIIIKEIVLYGGIPLAIAGLTSTSLENVSVGTKVMTSVLTGTASLYFSSSLALLLGNSKASRNCKRYKEDIELWKKLKEEYELEKYQETERTFTSFYCQPLFTEQELEKMKSCCDLDDSVSTSIKRVNSLK